MRSTAAEAAAFEGKVDAQLKAMRAIERVQEQQRTPPSANAEPIVVTWQSLEVAVRPLVDLRDAAGDRLRLERDTRDGRTFLTFGEPDDERPWEVSEEARAALAALLGGPASVTVGGAWGDRKRLPPRRQTETRAAEVGGTKVHLGTDFDAAGIRTVWIDVAKEGSPVRGLLHVIAGLASLALQHGAKTESVAKIMSEPEFDPAGKVEGDEQVTSAKSIPDYVAQVLLSAEKGGRR